ncbi:MAG: MBL fold metallo-hydrolase [Acidobacteriota bacterium]
MRSVVLGGLVIFAAAVAAIQAAQQPKAPPRFNFGPVGAIQKIVEDLYVVPGAGGNSTVFVTAKGVVLVDTKTPNSGQAILDQVKTVTDKPIIAIVNTHVHLDHTGSNAFFADNVEIVAHENAAAGLQKDPNFQAPDANAGSSTAPTKID